MIEAKRNEDKSYLRERSKFWRRRWNLLLLFVFAKEWEQTWVERCCARKDRFSVCCCGTHLGFTDKWMFEASGRKSVSINYVFSEIYWNWKQGPMTHVVKEEWLLINKTSIQFSLIKTWMYPNVKLFESFYEHQWEMNFQELIDLKKGIFTWCKP